MSQILKNTGGNLPGIKKIEYVFLDEVISTEVNLSDFTAVCSLIDSASWKQIYFTPGSADQELDKEVQTDAGMRYDQRINFREPRIRNYVSRILSDIHGRKIILRITDQNDYQYLFGTKENYVQMRSGGKTSGSYQGYQVEFFTSLSHPIPFIYIPETETDPAG